MPVQIAVIDDENDVLDIIKYNLDKEGFQVSVYSDCESALEGFQSRTLPDLIICDWMLPGMSGFDLLKLLKANIRYKLIPFIMVTCHNTSRFITDALNNGADDYLTKPFKLKELVARVHKRLNQVDKDQHLLLKEDFKQVDQKHHDHLDSLKSAKRIQSAVLPSQNYFLNKYNTSFIFNKPKDVVSGDFFWYAECYDSLFVAVADCTGHGVPGALTSIMGNMFLNQLVFDKRIMDAGTILKELNMMMVNALNNQTHTERMYEGMDIGLMIIDRKQKQAQFAGALHNLWLVSNNTLQEYKGMRYPIGGFQLERDKTFKTHRLQLQRKDRIYLKTDGFADQFGKSGKKFLTKRLKSTLVSMQPFPIQVQQLELESIFNMWKGEAEQTDDVMLFGYEVE
ncbi:MAG: response regulator [Bacteroidetes bacterium]|nr:response regulator [Bacteroidota bacterium]